MVGNYRLISRIGEGSIGRVFLAEHVKLGRKVALKMLRRRYSKSQTVISRFFLEARALNKIDHEHVVEVTDFLESTDGKCCYVMELLRGESLADLLAVEKPLSLRRSLNIARQIATALVAVHEQGIVHRDVKPDNVFMTESKTGEPDFVKLIDFGVAKLADDDDQVSLRHRTAAGALIGTPEYMAPEQTLGLETTPAADVYALGILLFELMSGHRPFAGPSLPQLFDQQRSAEPPRLSEVVDDLPPGVEALVARCLDKDPEQRPTMQEVETELVLLQISAPRRPRPAMLYAGITLAIGLGIFSVAAVTRMTAEPPIAIEPQYAQVEDRKMVNLEVVSSPPGATITSAGKVLGQTPFSIELSQSGRTLPISLSLDGYAPATTEVSLNQDAQVSLRLSRLVTLSPVSVPRTTPKRRTVRRRPKKVVTVPAVKRRKRKLGRIDRSEIRDPFGGGS